MRYASRTGACFTGGDMTPMIDMTFQLIAFFMVLVNFSGAEHNQLIHLPSSELAVPPDTPTQSLLTLQLTSEGTVIFGPDKTPLAGLRPLLLREWSVIEATPGRDPAETIVIIRADRDVQTGKVQEVMQICRATGFERFALRAKQQRRL